MLSEDEEVERRESYETEVFDFVEGVVGREEEDQRYPGGEINVHKFKDVLWVQQTTGKIEDQ